MNPSMHNIRGHTPPSTATEQKSSPPPHYSGKWDNTRGVDVTQATPPLRDATTAAKDSRKLRFLSIRNFFSFVYRCMTSCFKFNVSPVSQSGGLNNPRNNCYINSALQMAKAIAKAHNITDIPEMKAVRGTTALYHNNAEVIQEAIPDRPYHAAMPKFTAFLKDYNMADNEVAELHQEIKHLLQEQRSALQHGIQNNGTCTIQQDATEMLSHLLQRLDIPDSAKNIYYVDKPKSQRSNALQDLLNDQLSELLKVPPATFTISLQRFEENEIQRGLFQLLNPIEDLMHNIVINHVNYEAMSIICHLGTEKGGHYYTCRKNESSNWMLYDDKSVTQLSNNSLEHIRRNVYAISYKQKTASPPINPYGISTVDPASLPSTTD